LAHSRTGFMSFLHRRFVARHRAIMQFDQVVSDTLERMLPNIRGAALAADTASLRTVRRMPMLHCSYDVTGQEAFSSRVNMTHAIVSGREGGMILLQGQNREPR
jgi:hypothetical protein